MSKDKLTDYSATAASNTDIGGVNIDEGMLPSNVNNALREQMSHLADFAAGTTGIDILNLQDDDASHSIKIQAPATVTATTTLILPDGDGSANQVLTTDGSGTLSWGDSVQSFTLYEYTATADQTTFTGSDDNAATLSYTAGSIIVFMNGVALDPSDYTATNGTSLVLSSGAALNDIVNIISFGAFTVADTVSASAGGTFNADVKVLGDVGIGTSSPNARLELEENGATTLRLTRTNATSNYAEIEAAGGNGEQLTIKSNVSNQSGGFLAFDVSGSERMRIDSSGKVGIGTSSPNANTKLDVNGAARIGNSTDGIMIENNSGAFDISNAAYIRRNSSTGALELTSGSTTARNMIFNTGTNGAESMRIDSSGYMWIKSTGGTNPWDATSGTFAKLGDTYPIGATAQGAIVAILNRNTTTGTLIECKYNGAVVGSISVTGSSTAYNTSSDYRLKENVTPTWDATTRLKQLNPVRFNFIADADTTVDGFLAHEVQDVVPEAISGTKDAMRDEEYEVTPAVLDEDGNVVTEAVMGTRSVPDYQGIDQSKLVPLLVKTIQELEARIAALENV